MFEVVNKVIGDLIKATSYDFLHLVKYTVHLIKNIFQDF